MVSLSSDLIFSVRLSHRLRFASTICPPKSRLLKTPFSSSTLISRSLHLKKKWNWILSGSGDFQSSAARARVSVGANEPDAEREWGSILRQSNACVWVLQSAMNLASKWRDSQPSSQSENQYHSYRLSVSRSVCPPHCRRLCALWSSRWAICIKRLKKAYWNTQYQSYVFILTHLFHIILHQVSQQTTKIRFSQALSAADCLHCLETGNHAQAATCDSSRHSWKCSDRLNF